MSNDFEQEYHQAQIAYLQGNYEEALNLANRLIQGFPNNPSNRLLLANIHSIFQHYSLAREQYQAVLDLTTNAAILNCAKEGLESAEQHRSFCQFSVNNFKKSNNYLNQNIKKLVIEKEQKEVISRETQTANSEEKNISNLLSLSTAFTSLNTLKEFAYSTVSFQTQQASKDLNVLKKCNTDDLKFNPFEYCKKSNCDFEQLL